MEGAARTEGEMGVGHSSVGVLALVITERME